MPSQPRHFDQELEQLQSKLLAMSALVESALYRGVTAAVQKDRGLAAEVLRNEASINRMEIEIDDQAISLLALHQPMAGDLRLIISAIKINKDLERMGDLAVNIAQRALALMDEPMIVRLIDLFQIGALVQDMVRKALNALVNKSADLAYSVLASNDSVDNLRTTFFQELISFMQREPSNVAQGLNLSTIVRNLERMADHATNIAEDALYYIKGTDVRHNLEKVEREEKELASIGGPHATRSD